MAYKGYFFQWGDFIFPMECIKWGSYECAPNQRQSLNAYTDENGLTHDNALPHTKTEIKFTTLPLWQPKWDFIMGNIVKNYITFDARDAYCVYYDFETGGYKTGHFYFDKSFRSISNSVKGVLKYAESSWMFIEY